MNKTKTLALVGYSIVPIAMLLLTLVRIGHADEDDRTAGKWFLISTVTYLAGGIQQLNLPMDSYDACMRAKEKLEAGYRRMGQNVTYDVLCISQDLPSGARKR